MTNGLNKQRKNINRLIYANNNKGTTMDQFSMTKK